MKKSLIIILLFLLGNEFGWAQSQDLKFYYIIHSVETPVAKLCEDLKDFQRAAKNWQEPTIFYLSNMTTPIIACYNVDGFTNDDERFASIIAALQGRNYHSVDATTDVLKITSLLEQARLQDKDGDFNYSHFYWRVYLTQEYWQLKYNEKILAKILYIMDLQNAAKNFIRLDIYYAGEDEFVYDENYPLGKHNVCPNISPIFVQQ